MNIIRKDATITNTGPDDEFPGSFEVVLSTPAKDRDGDELAAEDWKQPLPDHITFDQDHGMSVASTVGSGVPTLEDGKLIVRGTYSSLPRAQEVRTLVKEGHIRTTSVAFMSERVTKDGKSRTQRELLNGAFVAIPSNREAVVLAAKALAAKAGARHSAADRAHVQAIYEHAVALGAGPMDDTQAEEGATGGKSVPFEPSAQLVNAFRTLARKHGLDLYGHTFWTTKDGAAIHLKAKYDAETLRQMLADGHALRGPDGAPSYPIGDVEDLQNAVHAVGRGNADHDKIRAYIIRRAKDLGHSDLIPDNWNADGSLKSLADAYLKAFIDADDTISPARLAQAVDASLDDAVLIIDQLDRNSLPPQVQQLVDTVTAASVCVDKLLDAMGVDDPDDTDNDEGTAAGPAAPEGDAAKSVDAEALELKRRVIELSAAAI